MDRTNSARANLLVRFVDSTTGLWITRVAFGAVLLLMWEMITRFDVVSPFWISQPTRLADRLATLVVSAQFYRDLYVTGTEIVLGMLIGMSLGILSGIILGLFPRLFSILDPFITVIYSMPAIALAPLFILWLGIGLASKVVLAMFIAYFLLLINTHSGMKSVDRDLVNTLKLMGSNDLYILRKVTLPTAVPWMFSGLRMAMPRVFAGAIVAEMLGAKEGIGLRLFLASGVFDTTGVFAYLLVMAGLAMVINEVAKIPEARVLHWRGTS